MQTVIFIAISVFVNWLIYKLIDSLDALPKTKALLSAVLVNLAPLGFAVFSTIDVRALILAYIIETFFMIALSVYDVVIAKASNIIRLVAIKQIVFKNIPGTIFYLIFFLAFAFGTPKAGEGVYISEAVKLENIDSSWLTDHLDQFLITLVFFACYYLYKALVDRRDETVDRNDLDQGLKHMQVRDNIMYISTFMFAFLMFLDSRLLLVILILARTIAYVVAVNRQFSPREVSEFFWVDVAEHLWKNYKRTNNIS